MQESKKDVTGTIRMHVVRFKQSSVLLSTSRTLEFVEDTLNRHKCSLGIVYEILRRYYLIHKGKGTFLY